MKQKEISNLKGTNLFADITKEKRIIKYRAASVRKEDTPGNKRKEIIPMYDNVPLFDTVLDDKGEVHHIGVISQVLPGGEVKFGRFAFGVSNAGWKIIDPKRASPRDKMLYQFFEATNYNGSNPNRDKKRQPLFYRVDDHKEAENDLGLMSLIHKAQGLVLTMIEDDLLAIDKILTLPEAEGKTVPAKRKAIVNYAGINPQGVIDLIENQSRDVIAKLKVASARNIITYSKKPHEFKYKEERILELPAGILKDSPYELLFKHLKEEDSELLDTILSQLKFQLEDEKRAQEEIDRNAQMKGSF